MAKNSDNGPTWSHELVRRIGAAMQSARGKRTAKWLSDRTAEVGYRVSPTVIAKLDSGHRGNVLSVAELLVIAAALDVPPVGLLFPDLPDGDVEMLPGEHTSSIDALLRFTGELDRDPPSALGQLVYLARTRRSIEDERADTLRTIARLGATEMSDNERDEVVQTIREITEVDRVLQQLNRQIAALPGAVLSSDESDVTDHA